MGPLDLRQQEYARHCQELLREAEQRRLMKQATLEYPRHSAVRRVVSRVGSFLILVGTRLERVEPA